MFKIFKNIFIISLTFILLILISCTDDIDSDIDFGLVPTIESVITKRENNIEATIEARAKLLSDATAYAKLLSLPPTPIPTVIPTSTPFPTPTVTPTPIPTLAPTTIPTAIPTPIIINNPENNQPSYSDIAKTLRPSVVKIEGKELTP